MKNMQCIDLFAGIGGFPLAARWMGWNCLAWCEWNEFCQKVLKYHFPNAKEHGDITKTDFTIYRGQCDILTGGFPCQPFSVAGQRKGQEDDRFLWPEMLRAVREIEPRWIVAENVYGLLNIDGGYTPNMVCADLEAIGYERPIIFDCTADAFGLSTMERHIWFISKAISERCERGEEKQNQDNGNERKLQGANPGIFDRRDISATGFRDVGERVSKRLDRDGKNWIKAGGNAIPPQVAYEIFKAIEQYETQLKLIA